MTTRTIRRITSIVLVVLVVPVLKALPSHSSPLTMPSRLVISSLSSLKLSSRLILVLPRWPDTVVAAAEVDVMVHEVAMVEAEDEVATRRFCLFWRKCSSSWGNKTLVEIRRYLDPSTLHGSHVLSFGPTTTISRVHRIDSPTSLTGRSGVDRVFHLVGGKVSRFATKFACLSANPSDLL